MNWATKAKINVGEKLDYKYCEIEIGMSIYMDDISVAGGAEEVKKRNKEMCKNGGGKENETQAKQNKVFGSKDRLGKEEDISEQVKGENIQRSKKQKYLGITIIKRET